MGKLSSKQEAFIALMKKSDEHARRGFDLLLKKPDFYEFFDDLADAGLFYPAFNPPPVPAEEAGYVQIPYWSALDYLKAVAKVAGEKNDLPLAEKVMNVVRAVSRAREPNGTIRDNYYIYRKFAEILGLVPTSAITEDDLDFIPIWLKGKYEGGMVGYALGEGAMGRFLESESPDDWNKALLILDHVTAIHWIDERDLGTDRRKPLTVVGDHYLKKFIFNNARALGIQVGENSAKILVQRVRETFNIGHKDLPSWLHRPAVEDHPQNHKWLGPENRFVEGLRDVLLSWVDHAPSTAQSFVEAMLRDEMEIIRRIGIYVLNQRWEVLKNLYPSVIGPELFDRAHLHELYNLLREHFAAFSENEKAATIKAIRRLPQLSADEDGNRRLRVIQRNWLSAIVGKGYEPVETWFNHLMSDEKLGGLSDHPGFHSYAEISRGPGPSPYQTQELVAFAENGGIIERLNAFQQPNLWGGTTTRGLVDALEKAVKLSPQTFLPILPDFLNAKRPFQYGVIAGFKSLWGSTGNIEHSLDWDKAWEELIQFFDHIIRPDEFWVEQAVDDDLMLTPNRDWIPPIIAEFLRAGTQNDEKAYPAKLLPKSWSILKILLERSKTVEEAPETDAMGQAINSTKGKAVEAAFAHALRSCRLSDRNRDEHISVWTEMKPVFDAEFAKCQNANYEFSTLAGAYLANLDYIDSNWLQLNMEKFFPSQFLDNFRCALGGLPYAQITPRIYNLLVENGVFDRALRDEIKDRRVRDNLIKRIALAYLQGEEELDSPRFSYLFESARTEDLEQASGWFWSIQKEELSSEQVERILQFWDRCVSWSLTTTKPPEKLLSNLSLLSCYLQSITDREKGLLLAVAPHVHVSYNTDFFFEELDRLADTNAAEVSETLEAVLDSYVPFMDYEDRLKSLLTKLAEHGKKAEAIIFAEKLRDIPGMNQIFNYLTSAS